VLPVLHAIGHAKGCLDTLNVVFQYCARKSIRWWSVGGQEREWLPMSPVPVRSLVVREGTFFLHDGAFRAVSMFAHAVEGWIGLVQFFYNGIFLDSSE